MRSVPPALAGLLCLLASAAIAAEPLVFTLTELSFQGGSPVDGGVAFAFDLGTKRVNWNRCAWSRVALAAPLDLSAYPRLDMTVTTDVPRRDAGVYLALQEADGSWLYHAWACDLTRGENRASVRLADFRPATWVAPQVLGGVLDHLDENGALDPEAITGIAFGCVNSLGIGRVAFTVTDLRAIPDPDPDATPNPIPVRVTGRLVDINGTTVIPAGLFGDFPNGAGPGDRAGSHRNLGTFLGTKDGQPHRWTADPAVAVLINCVGGDRYSTSGRLTDAGWQAHYAQSGRSLGEALVRYRETCDRPMVVEWWNEPYLNWSNQTRRNFKPELFDESGAVEGGPVKLKVDGSIAPHLKWTRDYDTPPWVWCSRREWRRGRDAQGRIFGGRQAPPESVHDGETYTAELWGKVKDPKTGRKVDEKTGEVELTAFTPWHVYDETQFTFWSGRGQLRHYNEPLVAFATALVQADPEAKVIVGWDFRPSEDHWAGWEMLYRPTLEAAAPFVHGVTDHDYGGDVTRMPANYEVMAAYGMNTLGRWLYSYNTECGENSDPSAYPDASASLQQAGKRWVKVIWCARKVLHALVTVPDKARTFTFHWFDEGAEGLVFRALRALRGRLVEVRCDDPLLYAVAAIDGTDPLLPRPEDLGPGRELVVAVFNDHGTDREVALDLAAPADTTFTAAILRRPVQEGEAVRLDEQRTSAKGTDHAWRGTVAAKSFVVLSLPLAGEPVLATAVLRRQFFADAILQEVAPDAPVRLKLAIPPDALRVATRVTLRCVFERLAEGEGTLTINGCAVALPSCPTPENICWIRDVPLKRAMLQTDNELIFGVEAPAHAGYHLCMASVVLDCPTGE